MQPPREILSRATVARLVPHERTPSGRARTYRDPQTGEVYTQRQRQMSNKAGLTPEQHARIPKEARSLVRAARNANINIESGLRRMAKANKLSTGELAKSRDFYRALAAAVKRRRERHHRIIVDDLFEMEIDFGDTYIGDD